MYFSALIFFTVIRPKEFFDNRCINLRADIAVDFDDTIDGYCGWTEIGLKFIANSQVH